MRQASVLKMDTSVGIGTDMDTYLDIDIDRNIDAVVDVDIGT